MEAGGEVYLIRTKEKLRIRMKDEEIVPSRMRRSVRSSSVRRSGMFLHRFCNSVRISCIAVFEGVLLLA